MAASKPLKSYSKAELEEEMIVRNLQVSSLTKQQMIDEIVQYDTDSNILLYYIIHILRVRAWSNAADAAADAAADFASDLGCSLLVMQRRPTLRRSLYCLHVHA